MSDRTPSTSFRAGPPSPSSPAAGSLKENPQLPVSSDHIPQTPTSPPLMSVSDQNHVSHFTSTQVSPNQATSQPPNTSSPPSSVPMSTQVSQQPTMSATNSFPTPASSVSGHLANTTSAEEGDHKSFTTGVQDQMKDEVEKSEQNSAEHSRTDHERQSMATGPEALKRDSATGPGQQSMDADAMEVDSEPVNKTDPGNLSLDSLQKNFTSAYHLCKSSPDANKPDPSFDLVSLYGLGPIAQTVARIDPVTGEKINRLRKSYEGKLKGLGLAGRNKPMKSDTEGGNLSSLTRLMEWPEEEWYQQCVYNKQIKVADIDSAMHTQQTQAMQMQPGTVPDNDFWEDVLGHEKPAKTQGSGDSGKKGAPTPGGRPSMTPHMRSTGSQEPERSRPSRGRKRHYDDNSFVGYGEGYADDDEDPGFYSNGEGTGKKKRKKDHISKVSTPMSERGGSYGVGMFGIGAR